MEGQCGEADVPTITTMTRCWESQQASQQRIAGKSPRKEVRVAGGGRRRTVSLEIFD